LFFVRRQPEDLGLPPDGGPSPVSTSPAAAPSASHPAAPAPAAADERSWTRREAVRSGTFWRLVFVFSIVMLAVNSVGVHRIPSFMDRGLEPRVISYATALDAAAAGLSTFAMGFLAQRVPARLIGTGGFLMLALASWLTIIAADHSVMFVAMISFGLGIGVLMLMQNYLWAEYFGRQHLGSIRGAVMPITLICGGLGAPLSGYVRDITGDYTPVWLTATGLMVLGGIIIALTPPPRAKPARTSVAPAVPVGAAEERS
ncbi:MAG TPA: MFS transporter, partial [Dehalococcoidia bacterium]|nr:MFS transporter [Dehalococcoidia bacterium]